MKTIDNIEIISGKNKKRKFVISSKTEAFEKFILVEASKLSLDDDFIKYKPKNVREANFKELLIDAIESGLKDFYKPKYDPSFNGKSAIWFEHAQKPATGMSYEWWIKVAKEFNPQRNSRLGSTIEYIAFLGVLIKKLMQGGWTLGEAWDAVCNDSKELGHYKNSVRPKRELELCGCREIFGFCDLANTFKILGGNQEGIFIAGGCYNNNSIEYPVSDMEIVPNIKDNCIFGVGWVILEN